MLYSLWDNFLLITDVKFFTGLVMVLFVGFTYWLVRFLSDSVFLACLFTPFVALSALVTHYMLMNNVLMPLSDKDSNMVLAVAAGVLIGLVVMMAVTRLAYAFGDLMRRGSHPQAGAPSMPTK